MQISESIIELEDNLYLGLTGVTEKEESVFEIEEREIYHDWNDYY